MFENTCAFSHAFTPAAFSAGELPLALGISNITSVFPGSLQCWTDKVFSNICHTIVHQLATPTYYSFVCVWRAALCANAHV